MNIQPILKPEHHRQTRYNLVYNYTSGHKYGWTKYGDLQNGALSYHVNTTNLLMPADMQMRTPMPASSTGVEGCWHGGVDMLTIADGDGWLPAPVFSWTDGVVAKVTSQCVSVIYSTPIGIVITAYQHIVPMIGEGLVITAGKQIGKLRDNGQYTHLHVESWIKKPKLGDVKVSDDWLERYVFLYDKREPHCQFQKRYMQELGDVKYLEGLGLDVPFYTVNTVALMDVLKTL